MRTTPLISAVFLAITFALLIGDLKHPERFYLILLKPQWRSWLVRGGVILGLFAALIAVHFFWPSPRLALIGIPIAIAAGTYTAFLFAQAKARDLWQSPLLAPQHLVACLMAGAATLTVVGEDLGVALPVFTLIHILLIVAEVVTPHGTAHARLAIHELVRGKFALAFWIGLGLQAAGFALTPIPQISAALILIGLFAYEHAHVGAGQAVPLA